MIAKGRVAVITGAAQGIGLAIAERLANDGVAVMCSDINEKALHAAVETICANGGIADAYVCDSSDEAQIVTMVDAIIGKYGRIDILVNNAGVTRDAMFKNMTPAQWDKVIDVNLRGPFLCTSKIVPHMLEKGYGRIINIASTSWLGNVGQTNYAASKGALVSMTRTLALELAQKGISVNAVAPGLIETSMLMAVPDKIKEIFVASSPSKRLGKPEEIAHLVAFLADDDSGYIQGQTISACGGISVGRSAV